MSIKELLNLNNSSKSVLLHVREPKLTGKLFREYGHYIITEQLKVDTYTKISEDPTDTDILINATKYSYFDLDESDFKFVNDHLSFEEIIRNDRAFRLDLSFNESVELIYGISKFYIEYFQNNPTDILVTNMPDCYVVDILIKVAKGYGVEVISFAGSSFGSKYMIISERGEYNLVRTPSNDEVNELYDFVASKKKNPYAPNRLSVYRKVMKYYLIYKIKLLLHYTLFYKLSGDSNYRYLVTKSEVYPKKLSNIFNIKKYFISDIRFLKSKEKVVYIPLHYYPESTTDYWIEQENYETYYISLVKVVKYYSSNGFEVVLKEHPSMYMYRDRQFYEGLSKISNTHIVDAFVSTYEILEFAEFVAVWTGTTGIEAIIHDKKVILTHGETYYSFGKLSHIGQEDQAKVFTMEEKKQMIRKVLESHLVLN